MFFKAFSFVWRILFCWFVYVRKWMHNFAPYLLWFTYVTLRVDMVSCTHKVMITSKKPPFLILDLAATSWKHKSVYHQSVSWSILNLMFNNNWSWILFRIICAHTSNFLQVLLTGCRKNSERAIHLLTKMLVYISYTHFCWKIQVNVKQKHYFHISKRRPFDIFKVEYQETN